MSAKEFCRTVENCLHTEVNTVTKDFSKGYFSFPTPSKRKKRKNLSYVAKVEVKRNHLLFKTPLSLIVT